MNKLYVSFPFLPVLTIIFIYLKLTGVIVWSWWLVLGPIWMPMAALLGTVAIVGILCVLVSIFNGK
jgi:hypothetical protein